MTDPFPTPTGSARTGSDSGAPGPIGKPRKPISDPITRTATTVAAANEATTPAPARYERPTLMSASRCSRRRGVGADSEVAVLKVVVFKVVLVGVVVVGVVVVGVVVAGVVVIGVAVAGVVGVVVVGVVALGA